MKTKNTDTQAAKAALMERVRQYLELETLETRGRDALAFHSIPVASLRAVLSMAFDAGHAAASGKPTPTPSTDPGDVLATLRFTNTTPRATGGTWIRGSIGGHTFGALVFREHAETPAYELGDSRISKLWVREQGATATVAEFDRGWSLKPTTPAAAQITDLLAAGLAEHVFGHEGVGPDQPPRRRGRVR